MEEIQQEAPFIIKNEKYSLDIILKSQTPNGIIYKGITIYKKDFEINFLNEESLTQSMNIKENDDYKNIIHSFANVGFISISDVICFLYLTENDIILLNRKGASKENIYYKVKNFHFIKMKDISNKEDENFKKNIEQFKDFFISENLYFSICKYGNNILNHHIDTSNNYCYNEKYATLFQETNTIEFITPLNQGFYRHFFKENNSNNNKINNEKNEYLELEIKIRNKIFKNEKNLVEIEDIINEKECFQEINIGIFSNIKNVKVNYSFYSYYGKYCSDIDFLFSLLNGYKQIKEGLILTAFDSIYNEEKEIKMDNDINSIKKSIQNEEIKQLFDIKITKDGRKDSIKKFIYENIDKIKHIFENNEKEKNVNNKLLIVSGTSDSSIFNLTQEIIYSILYFYFNTFLNDDNNNYDMLFNNVKLSLEKYYNLIDEIFGKRTMKLLKM